MGLAPGKLGPANIRHLVGAVVGGVLRYAVNAGLLQRDPSKSIELPGVLPDHEHLVCLDRVEIKHWTDAAYEANRALIYFLSYTGLRINETLASRAGDLNLTTGRVRILRSWTLNIDGLRIIGPQSPGRSALAPHSLGRSDVG